jgi:hypothetical protein
LKKLFLDFLHNPALLRAGMDLEPVAAVHASLYSRNYFFRIGLLPVLTLGAYDNQ